MSNEFCSKFYGIISDETVGIYRNAQDLIEIICTSKNSSIKCGPYKEVFEEIKASLSEDDQKAFGIVDKQIKFDTLYTKRPFNV